jgi:pimeloyl-ACP methyl ester carboxylesterase
MFIETADHVRLYYTDWGRGDPIVMIHGWPLNSDMWEYQARHLARTHRVICYDRRGFGRSSKPFEGYDYDGFAGDLRTILDHLNLSNVTLVGFSMGGGEVARYLGRYGSRRISKAVLISSVVPYLLKTEDNPEGADKKVFEDMIENLEKDRPQFLAEFTKKFYGFGMLSSPVSEGILDWTAFMAYQGSPEATIRSVTAFGTTDFRPDLKNFDVPTLIIHGREDQTVPIKASAEQAAQKITGAKTRFYDDAPHGLFVTHKEALLKDLQDFIGISASPRVAKRQERVINPAHH